MSTGINPRRIESVCISGLILQALAGLAVLILSKLTDSWSLWIIAGQVMIGIFFWGLSLWHLRLRRAVRDEELDLAKAERDRKQRGMQQLFDKEEEGDAARNLRQFERFASPVSSFFLALMLAIPALWFAAMLLPPWELWFLEKVPELENSLVSAVVAIGIALGCFLLGMYAAGLSREKHGILIRAGGGYMLSSAVFLFLAGFALALGEREWGRFWPDMLVASLVFVWMTLQAVEIVVNMILGYYRPRVAGVVARPAYDSRFSGLLAEPQGLFKTFAHTLDYQFGFKVSDTWFFSFLEKAFAPLLLIQLLALYLMTTIVTVRPGEAAIIERWGAPRGESALPEDSANWDALEKPKGPGLHFKWPWPIEAARKIPRERLQMLHVGFSAKDEADSLKKARELAVKTVGWGEEHVKDEHHYIMPMTADNSMKGDATTNADGVASQVDALFLSGTFSIEYRVGPKSGDVYRYVYLTRTPAAVMQSLFEREVSAYLAGANFWSMLVDHPHDAQRAILKHMREAVAEAGIGIEVVTVNIHTVHPPAGNVGKAYQDVLAARQEREAKVLGAQAERNEILGLAPSARHEIVSVAEAYRYAREVVAKAEAKRFASQLKAWNAAPEVYTRRVRMQAIEEALADTRLILHPPEVEVRIDSSEMPSPEDMTVRETIMKAK